MRKCHYEKALFSSREGHFSLRWIREIRAIKRRTCSDTSEMHIGELGVRYLSTLNREQDSRQEPPISHAVKQYRFALPPRVRSTHLYFEGSSAPPRERAIKSVFCTANLPTIMYFFSVISALCEVELSADPHTTHYNTDDFHLTPTTDEATYRPNTIIRKGIYLRRFSGQKPLSTSNHSLPILTTDVMKFQRLAALTCFVAAGILISSCDKETPRQEQKPAQPTTPVVQPEEPAAPGEARVAVAQPGGLEAALKGQDLEQLTKLTVRSGALNQADLDYVTKSLKIEAIDLSAATLRLGDEDKGFYGNSTLKKITAPADIEKTQKDWFSNTLATEIIFPGNKLKSFGGAVYNENAFEGFDYSIEPTFTVPKGTKDAYLKALNWSPKSRVAKYFVEAE